MSAIRHTLRAALLLAIAAAATLATAPTYLACRVRAQKGR